MWNEKCKSKGTKYKTLRRRVSAKKYFSKTFFFVDLGRGTWI
jgi:hypothetical protein